MSDPIKPDSQEGVAIIGMAGRFPGADDVAAFWRNLCGGVDSISRFTDAELRAAGVSQAALDTPGYVRARALFREADCFDAEFFGYNPREADLTDPQHRVFLETAWQALEDAGCDPERFGGSIGVYAGISLNTYLLNNLCADRKFIEELTGGHQVTGYEFLLGNDKDYVSTRVSYKLNLRGPSMTIQSACSTSLVAVSQACQSLLNYQCDVALAGAVSISFPRERGYLHQEGSLASADGVCRAFDAKASGTVFGDGAGVVVLKRLEDALEARDNIYAVIKGYALNNDGASKVGYTAPSAAGQAEVIAMAQEMAGFQPETITCIEAHGTATPLGDPIELAGLTQAFRSRTGNFCAIGSVKTNVGHLEVAAGVCGLMKTALALRHRLIPPSLHFEKPNPKIDFANSPFHVNTKLLEWKAGPTPRRAGVSSFGVGGTNAHVVLEEAPEPAPAADSRRAQLLVISAKTAAALDRATGNLAKWLSENETANLADVAWTLQTGRQAFRHRRSLVAGSTADAAKAMAGPLSGPDARRVLSRVAGQAEPEVVFLFPGQGTQYVNMGRELYKGETVFRDTMDHCADALREILECDLREIVYPAAGGEGRGDDGAEASRRLTRTSITQPALFAIEYSLATLWMSWGIRPGAMIGHSVGEYVAACLAGVFSLDEGLSLLARRAKLMQELPAGSMLAVRLEEEKLRPLLDADISLAAVNGPALSVASGPEKSIERLKARLEKEGIASKELCTSHAFHSAMMDPVLEPFMGLFSKVKLKAPKIPYISNLSADWITPEQATSPAYWARHLRETVRFSDGVRRLAQEGGRVLLEVGPGQSLATLAKQHPSREKAHPEDAKEQTVATSLPNSAASLNGDVGQMLQALGQLWMSGVAVDWSGFYREEERRRVHLPGYSFERVRHYVEPPKHSEPLAPVALAAPAAAAAVATLAPKMETLVAVEAAQAGSRKDRIVAGLTDVLQGLSGRDRRELDPAVNFFELGFDSLFLTQASQGFRKKFGVKVTFRQLLEELSCLDAIADYMDKQLPPDAVPVAATTAVTTATAVVATTARKGEGGHGLPAQEESALDKMSRQLQEMAREIEAMRSGKVPAAGNGHGAGNGAAATAPEAEKPKFFGPYRPIDKAAGVGFTERQQAHLDALTDRYTKKTPGSKKYTQDHRKHFADPRAVAGFRQFWKEMVYPVVAARSLGSKIWDIDGNEYVDVTMGFGTNILGHAPGFITDAVRRQLENGVEVGPQSPVAGQVAELMCELTGMDRASFCNTGSEAVLAAIRLARTVTGRTRIATMSGAFHGINDEVLVRAVTVNGETKAMPVAPGIPANAVSEVSILEWGSMESLEVLKGMVDDLAAVLVEPVQSRHPDVQPVEFLREVRRITEQAGTALIFDEVITGFRSHPGGAQALFGIKADIATYGKIIGGGMPIGAVCGRAEYMDALDGGAWSYGDASFPEVGVTFFAGTYVRHPLAMAAAHAMLVYLKNSGPALQEALARRTERFATELNAFFEKEGAAMRITWFRSIFYFDFGAEIKYPSLLFFHLREKGVHIWEGRPCFLSTAHTEADVRFVIKAFKESVLEMKAGGFVAAATARMEEGVVAAPVLEKAAESPRVEVLANAPRRELAPAKVSGRKPGNAAMQFSLYFFGNYEAGFSPDKYDLLFGAAKFADKHGFTAIWLPERHFHAVGGFSPNPAVLAAALARETERIQLRGGSVVFPLHHPIRIAEEWAVVDNLSKGRTGVSIASGWHPNDFVFAPGAFEKRREICFEGLDVVRKLWSGESVRAMAGAGNEVDVRLYPMPMQKELPVWLTCIHEESFVKAGEMGVGVLGYLMNQKMDEVGAKIALYRESLVKHGHDPAKGHVTILLHTFVGKELEEARATARGPLRDYLRSFLDNNKRKVESEGGRVEVDPEDIEDVLDVAFEDYVEGKALIGTPESCAKVMERLAEIGVDEVGCFVDFGIDPDAVLRSLGSLEELKNRCGKAGAPIELAPVERTLPLAPAQQGLWVSGTDEDAARAYHESVTLRMRGELDEAALRGALQALINRHEALRATIALDGTQRVAPAGALDIRMLDLTGDEARERKAVEWLREFENELFVKLRGPFMRAGLVTLAEKEYLLALTFHHVMGNGPSYWVFLEELCELYEAARTGTNAALPAPMQLSDFIEWDAQRRADSAEAEAFWVGQFKQTEGGAPVLELPADHPRPSILTFRGERQAIRLDADFTKKLRHAAAARKCSLFNVLLSAFAVLLHKLSGQDDVVIGVPFEDEVRTLDGGEALFANTTNVMPIRSRIEGDPAFDDYMAAMKDLVLDAAEHQNYFFGRLINALHLQRDPARAPIFSTIFNFESGEFRKNLGGLEVELVTGEYPYRGAAGTAMAELYLNAAEKDGALEIECDHNSDLYDAETVARWMGHYRTILEGIVADPNSGVRRLPLLSEAERRQIVVDWNATEVDYPKNALLHRVVEEQVNRTPDAVAVAFGRESLTYRELNSRANQLAHYLISKGIGPDAPVGICMERSLEMVTGLLGILKVGGAYVPLDPDYPRERLAFMMADARMPVLLTQERLVDRLPGHGAEVICLDAGWFSIAREPDGNPNVALAPENLAYVIYTSGSTGKPKGAMNTHAGICNRLFWMQDAYRLTAEDRVLQKTPFSFDVSVWEFFWPLITGARLVMAQPGGHQDAGYLIETIMEQGITVIHFVPPMLAVFLEARGVANCRTLRCVICSGEALSYELQERFFAVLYARLHNLYGPTEASVDVTHWTCPRDSKERVVPIGKPIANIRIYLLDARMEPVPVGVAGELHIAGVGLARGYWERPELTAQSFVADPFDAPGIGRLYKTGDLARWRPDGNILYLGRMDHQVKVRGFRIELEEIEGALNRHALVRDAVVIAREEREGDRRLVAYVVARGGVAGDLASKLRADLKNRLPEYMIPSGFVFLEAIPTTANGKVDRRALPAAAEAHVTEAPAAPGPEVGDDGTPPLERKLEELWKTVLAVKKVGLHDNFFELGGDSLLALRLVNQLSFLLEDHVSLVVVFQAPTIASLAELIRTNYPESAQRLRPAVALGEEGKTPTAAAPGAIDAQAVAEMRRVAQSMRPVEAFRIAPKKNPRAVFILNPTKSGASLCGRMLVGSPGLFVPGGIELLEAPTVAGRLGRPNPESVARAIAEAKGVSAEEAARLAKENIGSQMFYSRLQEWVAPRMLVDRADPMDPDVLKRAEEWFEDALYIHLVRHPLGMIHSYEKGRLILESPYRDKQNFSARQLAELTWLISHQNILQFLSDVPASRRHMVRFEEMVTDRARTMEAICQFLAIPCSPEMLEPVQNKDKSSPDGEIKPDAMDKWRDEYREDFLSEMTWRMARELGYENPFVQKEPSAGGRKELPPIVGVSRAARRVTRATL